MQKAVSCRPSLPHRPITSAAKRDGTIGLGEVSDYCVTFACDDELILLSRESVRGWLCCTGFIGFRTLDRLA